MALFEPGGLDAPSTPVPLWRRLSTIPVIRGFPRAKVDASGTGGIVRSMRSVRASDGTLTFHSYGVPGIVECGDDLLVKEEVGDSWLLKPGYCYIAMVQSRYRDFIADQIGAYPMLKNLLDLPIQFVAWDRLRDLWLEVQDSQIVHLQKYRTATSVRFITVLSTCLMRGYVDTESRWADMLRDVLPDMSLNVDLTTVFGVRTKGGDELMDFSDFAKLVQVTNAVSPVPVAVRGEAVNGDEVQDVGVICVGERDTEIPVKIGEKVEYSFVHPRVVWLTPGVVIESVDAIKYGSDKVNVWILVQGRVSWTITGAKAFLRLGNLSDFRVRNVFSEHLTLMGLLDKVMKLAFRRLLPYTVMNCESLLLVPPLRDRVLADLNVFVRLPEADNSMWELEELGTALTEALWLCGRRLQVSIVSWSQFLESVCDELGKREDWLRTTLVRRVVPWSTKVQLASVAYDTTALFKFEGVVLVRYREEVVSAQFEFPLASVRVASDVRNAVYGDIVLRVYTHHLAGMTSKLLWDDTVEVGCKFDNLTVVASAAFFL